MTTNPSYLRYRGVAGGLALLMLAGLARPAIAGDEAEKAQAHLHRAAAQANLGNYADAAKEYEAAYLWTSAPNLLVDVGRTWQLAGDHQKALAAFRSYVRVAPSGEHRAFCEAKIRELEAQPAAAPLPAPMAPPMPAPTVAYPPPSPPPPMPAPMVPAPPPPLPYAAPPAAATSLATSPAPAPVAESPVYHRWPFWVVLGTVVVAGAAVAIWYTTDRDLAMPTTTFGTKQF